MSKRVWKLQDFVAHASSRVHCARLGEKSGQVLATGADDKRVNVWKVGKANAMMSLTGHNSAVECLVFDKQEEVLVVGCGGGSIQVWNLEHKKMSGTLTGHRTACSAVEFHPYGEFFASGSADTNLKIWDLRRKSCIQTYKGHTGSITSIKFSPHGRWVATGGQDNQVKIWDLTAGKLMRDLEIHQAPVTSIAFHPKEYLLATGSADRTMKLWSLETFRPVHTTDFGSSPVQAVKFYVEEQGVLSASHDSLKFYSLDNLSTPVDTIDVDWRGLQDMRLCFPEEKLIAITTEASQLGIWVADLQKKQATSTKPATSSGYGRAPARAAAPKASAQAHHRSYDDADSGDILGSAASGNDDAVPEVTQMPSRASAKDRPAAMPSPTSMPTVAPPERAVARGAQAARSPTPNRGVGAPGPIGRIDSGDMRVAGRGEDVKIADFGREDVPSADRERPRMPPQEPLQSPVNGSSSRSHPSGASSPKVPSSLDDRGGGLQRLPRAAEINLEQMGQLSTQHGQMMGVLQRRLEQVHRLRDLWDRGSLASLHSVLNVPQDHAVFCDFSREIMRQGLASSLNLESCQTLLPILRDLMTSKYEDFVAIAVQFVEVLLQHFGSLISETRKSCAGIPERQLDLAREERLQKCNACYKQFEEIHRLLPEGQRRLSSSLLAFFQRS